MKVAKSLRVFGDPVDFLVTGPMSHGTSSVLIHTAGPGDGPPPHSHANEDETFTVLEGEFELLVEGQWVKLPVGEVAFAPRGGVHTFRNSGTTTGRILTFVSPGGFENYLEEIGPLSPATDMEKIIEISTRYGVTFHLS